MASGRLSTGCKLRVPGPESIPRMRAPPARRADPGAREPEPGRAPPLTYLGADPGDRHQREREPACPHLRKRQRGERGKRDKLKAPGPCRTPGNFFGSRRLAPATLSDARRGRAAAPPLLTMVLSRGPRRAAAASWEEKVGASRITSLRGNPTWARRPFRPLLPARRPPSSSSFSSHSCCSGRRGSALRSPLPAPRPGSRARLAAARTPLPARPPRFGGGRREVSLRGGWEGGRKPHPRDGAAAAAALAVRGGGQVGGGGCCGPQRTGLGWEARGEGSWSPP